MVSKFGFKCNLYRYVVVDESQLAQTFYRHASSLVGPTASVEAHMVGMYKLNPVYPWLEISWFQPLNFERNLLVSKFAFNKCNFMLYRYDMAAQTAILLQIQADIAKLQHNGGVPNAAVNKGMGGFTTTRASI